MKYILNLGHREIGLISAKTEFNDRARYRLMAVQHGMIRAGLDPTTIRLIETQYGIKTGAVAFNEIISAPHPPTIIICGNDVLAAGALKKAKSLGISIPDDISITGFDDIELAQCVSPKLTTVHVPHREMGKQAAKTVIKMVNKEVFEKYKELDIHLKIRQSLGKPKTNIL